MTTGANEPTRQLAIRLPESLVERLEGHVTRMRAASPGVDIKRADAVRALLHDALDRAERVGQAPRKAKG
jgi:hypothetical protein